MLGQKVFLDFVYDLSVNTLEDLDEHACNPEMNHHYDTTFYELIANENEKHFNCSVPFHPPITSRITKNTIEICNNSDTGKKACENWSNSMSAGPQTPKNKPCARMDIFLGLPFIDSEQPDHEASIRIYIKSDVKVKSVIMYYDFTTLAAEVGGYIGMFLGISLVDFTIICNSALFKVVSMKLKQKYQHKK